MSWRIEVKPSAEKQYLRLDAATHRRIKTTLRELEGSEQPFLHPRMRPLTGQLSGDYRERVGGWRILLTSDRDSKVLLVYAILPRGDAY
jgi:mRNA interferase RelE/StbE